MLKMIVNIQELHIFSVISTRRRPVSILWKRYSTTDVRSWAGSSSRAKAFHLQSIIILVVTWICLVQSRSIKSQRPRYRKDSEHGRGVIFSEPSTDQRNLGSPS